MKAAAAEARKESAHVSAFTTCGASSLNVRAAFGVQGMVVRIKEYDARLHRHSLALFLLTRCSPSSSTGTPDSCESSPFNRNVSDTKGARVYAGHSEDWVSVPQYAMSHLGVKVVRGCLAGGDPRS